MIYFKLQITLLHCIYFLNIITLFIYSLSYCLSMVEITKHFTSSVYIVFENKVLLHVHKKYDMLLPVGGHIDRDELPADAAAREAKEESGLDVEIFNSRKYDNFEDGEKMNFEKEINIGEFCNLHYVNEFHQHIDFTFFAKAFSNVLKPAKGETKALYWFTREEIISQTKIKTSTKKYALYALDNVK